MSLQSQVREFTAKFGLLSHDDRILVAVSGGPDSVALLHLLRELRGEFNLHLEVAHLQHGIRGKEAKNDARFVAHLAESLKLPFHLKEINLPLMKAQAGKGNLEALARAERHRFFADVAARNKLDKVATAHTQDDQAETVLMWILRGTGMKGLGGMSALQKLRVSPGDSNNSITVVRPLLNISKSELLAYLKEKKLAYRLDQTNKHTALLRNWIRHKLLPVIKRRIGEDFSARLSREAELLGDEDRYLDELAIKRVEMARAGYGLDRNAFLREATALQRRMLRFWIAQTRGHLRGLEFVHIEDLLRLIIQGPAQGRMSIPGGWELVREYDALKLEKRKRGSTRVCYSYPFQAGTTLRIAEAGYELQSDYVTSATQRPPIRMTEAIFDAACLSASLTVRNFRPGDRFQPLGMSGHKKVKELFIEKKVPLSIRSRLPILLMGEEILWVPGYARSEVARVSESTTAVLHVKATTFKP